MKTIFFSGLDRTCSEFHCCLEVKGCIKTLICPKVLDVPLTVKIRTGVQEKCNIAHKLIPEMKKWGVSMITVSLVVEETLINVTRVC